MPRTESGSEDPRSIEVPRLFGTDGIRGTAGTLSARSADGPPYRRGAGPGLAAGRRVDRLAAASDRPRYSRVGRVDRSGARARRGRRRRAGDERRRRADAGVAYLTRTAGYDAGVVISASHNPFDGQRHQGVFGPWRKVHRAGGTRSRSDRGRSVLARARTAAPAAVTRADLVGAYLDHLRAVFPEATLLTGSLDSAGPFGRRIQARDRLRERRDDDRRAGAVRRPRIRDRRDRESPRRQEHQPALRIDPSRRARADRGRARPARWASRSTATAIAPSSWIIAARL